MFHIQLKLKQEEDHYQEVKLKKDKEAIQNLDNHISYILLQEEAHQRNN